MHSPATIDFCLVCDDLRLETANKVTILGFYGLLPRVRIILQEWGRPIDRIAFLVSTHGATQPYSAQLKIVNPNGSTLVSSPNTRVESIGDPTNSSAVAFGFPMLTFQHQGEHKIEVLIDGIKAYESTFIAQSSRPTVKI